MNLWEIIFTVLAFLFTLFTFLPISNLTHWTVRIFDFIRIQLLILQLFFFSFGFLVFKEYTFSVTISYLLLFISIVYQVKTIFPYIPFFNSIKVDSNSSSISVISVNVLQSNQQYQKLIDLVNKHQPDILLTLESNSTWENALEVIENQYSSICKIPKENTYGMHFYTKLDVIKLDTHYFLTEERPAIVAHLKDKHQNEFVFWGIHPPPPSPTEETTSKQKDSELMSVAKLVRSTKAPTIVIGDFNNVCWSNISKLFAKVSQLKDARINRGLYATFPVRPWLFRFPIDLLFHSKELIINSLKTLEDIGSDHLPLYSKFAIIPKKRDIPKMETDLKEEVHTIIQEGEIAQRKGI